MVPAGLRGGHPRNLGFSALAPRRMITTMATERARARCSERIGQLSESAADVDSLRHEAVDALRPVLGFDRWCSLLVDPDTLVASRGIGRNDWSSELKRLNLHNGLSDINSPTILARSRDPIGVLSAATGGDLARSPRWSDILAPYGVGDELRCVGVDDRGCWVEFLFWRDHADRPFDVEDARLLRDAAPSLGTLARRATVAIGERPPDPSPETGVLLLDHALRPLGATPPARAWFDILHPGAPDGVPPLVWNVVGRLLAVERGEEERPARARVRTHDGRWAVLDAARLDGPDGGIAVSVRPARPDDLLDLVCRATGLSARERELVALVVEGLDTKTIARRLHLSEHTVQDHLKSVFAKAGVRSRRELVSLLAAQAA
jgi:DNA-binding CsgD family transcriptional regulator